MLDLTCGCNPARAVRCRFHGNYGTTIPHIPFWALHEDEGEALAVLTKMGCPAPCVGHRDPSGEDWHELCEQKARAALAALRNPHQPTQANDSSEAGEPRD